MIVVFGSLNIDVVMLLERLPQQGETLLGGRYLLVPGGKGANQACAAARAGARVAMVGCVGRDDWGDRAVSMLQEAGVDLSAMARSGNPTACASIFVDAQGQNAIGVASGANLDATADQVPDGFLGPDTWLVLQMEVSASENWALIPRAKAAGARVILSVAPAAPVPAEILETVDILVLNEVEARMVAGAEGLDLADPIEIARTLAARHGLTAIATLGAQGTAAIGPAGAWRVEALPVAPVDTTGAGDAFVGGLAAALESRAALPEALRFANAAAGLCCTVAGTQSSFARKSDILQKLDHVPAPRPLAA